MNSIETILLYDLFVAAWAFFGAGMAVVLGAGIVLGESAAGRNGSTATASESPVAARTRNRIFFALCVCIAWFLWNQSLAFSGALWRAPGWLWVDVPAVLCIGPLLYLFYRARTGSEAEAFRLRFAHGLHFIAPAAALVLLWPLYQLNPAEALELLREVLSAKPRSADAPDPLQSHEILLSVFRTGDFSHTPVLFVTAFASEASIVLYTLPILWNLRDVFIPGRSLAASDEQSLSFASNQPHSIAIDQPSTSAAGTEMESASLSFRWLTALLALGAAVLALLGLGALSGFVELARLTVLGLTTMVCLLHVVDRAWPSYFDRLFAAGRRARYRKSRLGHLDTDRIAARLHSEMQNDRPYLRDDLTLPELARRLEVTPHQLSEFLNHRLGKSFHTVVNEYRIAAARALLANGDDTVLSIAYAVGFNNRASFNAAFAKFTGTTPVAYRRTHAGAKAQASGARRG